MKRAPRGRPRIEAGERRDELLWSRVTKAEADAVQRAALRARQTVSDFLRLIVKQKIQIGEDQCTMKP